MVQPLYFRRVSNFSGYGKLSITERIGCTSAASEPVRGLPPSCRWSRPVDGNNIPIRQYLGSVLPGLGEFPANRVGELTPANWGGGSKLKQAASSPQEQAPETTFGCSGVYLFVELKSKSAADPFLDALSSIALQSYQNELVRLLHHVMANW